MQNEARPLPELHSYDGGSPPARDKDGNIITGRGTGCGCLVYPLILALIVGSAWYAIDHWL